MLECGICDVDLCVVLVLNLLPHPGRLLLDSLHHDRPCNSVVLADILLLFVIAHSSGSNRILQIPESFPASCVGRGRIGWWPCQRLPAFVSVASRSAFSNTPFLRMLEHARICGCYHDQRFHGVLHILLCCGCFFVPCFPHKE